MLTIYTACCEAEKITLSADFNDEFRKQFIEAMKKIYRVKKIEELAHTGTVRSIYKTLWGGIEDGILLEAQTETFFNENTVFIEKLRKSTWYFSAAKNHADIVALNNLLITEDGKLRGWSDYKYHAEKIIGRSARYLKTEYDTIVAGAQMSRLWMEIQRDKHIFPFVQFDVVLDGRTSEICSPLHGLIFAVDDPVLAYYFPPNHFNCRTMVRKLRTGIPSENYDLPEIPEAFRNNVAVTGKIFTEKNKYIENTPEDVLKQADELYKEVAKEAPLEVRRQFELYKLKYPFYEKTDHPNVEISLWADRTELLRNKEVAKAVADFDASYFKVRPHIDGEILLNHPNPEYEYNSVLADRKSPEGLNIKNIFRKAHNVQNCEVVVIDLENNPFTVEDIYNEVVKKLKKSSNYPNFKIIYIVSKDMKTIKKYDRKKH